MSTEHLKSRIHRGAEHIERRVETATEKFTNNADALSRKQNALKDDFRDIAGCLRDGTKGLSEKIEKQARLHPLATFGCRGITVVVASARSAPSSIVHPAMLAPVTAAGQARSSS